MTCTCTTSASPAVSIVEHDAACPEALIGRGGTSPSSWTRSRYRKGSSAFATAAEIRQ